MYDSQNGGNGIVTAYAVFGGVQPQTEESIQMQRMREAMGPRLAAEEAARSPEERKALGRRARDERQAMMRQFDEKRAEKESLEVEGKRGFWRRAWCFA